MAVTTAPRSRWFRRVAGATGALLAALLVLPMPVLAGVTFTSSWTPGYYISAPSGFPTPPTPTYTDAVTSNGSAGQKDVLDVNMGAYSGNPAANVTQEAFETITLNRTFTVSSGTSNLEASLAVADMLNSAAQGTDTAVVLNNGVVVGNLLNPLTYTGTGNSPTAVNKTASGSLSQSLLKVGQTYTLQATVKFQTLVNNKLGGAWTSKSTAHVFTFYAQ